MTAHTHACHVCGDIFEHEKGPKGQSSADFQTAHTCANGHRCTVKYDAKVAEGLREVCKAGGDCMAYLKAADPMAALTLELEQEPDLSDAIAELQDAGPFLGSMIFDNLSKAMQDRVNTYAAKVEAVHNSKAA